MAYAVPRRNSVATVADDRCRPTMSNAAPRRGDRFGLEAVDRRPMLKVRCHQVQPSTSATSTVSNADEGDVR